MTERGERGREYSVPVECPSSSCGAVFDIPLERLGKNVYCLSCGTRMTAKPLEVDRQLRQREPLSGGGRGASPRFPFAALLDSVRSLWNVGSIFRSADACGCAEVMLTGITGTPPRKEITKTALGAEDLVRWRYCAEPLEALTTLRDEGYVGVALETSDRAVPLGDFEWPAKSCLVLGNEVAGVTAPLLDACEHHVGISMYGAKESFNVAVAFGIAAHHAAQAMARR